MHAIDALKRKGVALPNAAAMVAAPTVMLAAFAIHPAVAAGPFITLAAVNKFLAATAAHRPATLAGGALYGTAAALLIPAFGGLRTERAKGGRFVAVGVTVAQVGLMVVIATVALLSLLPYVLTAPGTDPAAAARLMHAINNDMGALYLGGLLFPLGTVVVTIGLLRDRAVRWWAIPFAIGTVPTLLIFGGVQGVIAAALMLVGFIGAGLRPWRAASPGHPAPQPATAA
jgi:hypothetical protein